MNVFTPDKGNVCVAHICGTRHLKSQTEIPCTSQQHGDSVRMCLKVVPVMKRE